MKLEKFRFKKEMGRNWYTKRTVDEWFGLGNPIISAKSIESFRKKIQGKLMNRGDRWN